MRVLLSRFLSIKPRENDFVYFKKEKLVRRVTSIENNSKLPKGVRLATQSEIQTSILMEIANNTAKPENKKGVEEKKESNQNSHSQSRKNRRRRKTNTR